MQWCRLSNSLPKLYLLFYRPPCVLEVANRNVSIRCSYHVCVTKLSNITSLILSKGAHMWPFQYHSTEHFSQESIHCRMRISTCCPAGVLFKREGPSGHRGGGSVLSRVDPLQGGCCPVTSCYTMRTPSIPFLSRHDWKIGVSYWINHEDELVIQI